MSMSTEEVTDEQIKKANDVLNGKSASRKTSAKECTHM
eukprot:CAMPEP_0181046286 /NCGR_PEP_ID=MMETSP1070-20121207/14264_1 /TAXON_ID=265543 /ORGANISM="Minutocellus polymorphus, Strain NH13" /LENGTH=37 /DNA_ID= /DNA_START= /DNA_END= /DNA_ORIENTATION=